MKQSPFSDKTNLFKIDAFFINLDSRADRLKTIKKQLNLMGLDDAQRIPAIQNENGALGCATSHLKILTSLSQVEQDAYSDKIFMICEDDIEFCCSRNELESIIKKFFLEDQIDVLVLSHNCFNAVSVSKDFLITSNVQTTACYLFKPYMIYPLLSSAAASVSGLSRGEIPKHYAIDIVWKTLQLKYTFAIPHIKVARQYPSYSDIEKHHADYTKVQ